MIDAKTRVCALLGNPVEHSLSPAIHNAAFSEKNLNLVYVAFAVKDIKAAVEGIRALGLKGLSVTIPHKVTVMPYLDRIHPLAESIGAVNTLVIEEDGALVGHNTDGQGALKALQAAKTPLEGGHCLMIGSGGAARAIAFTLLQEGDIGRLTIAGVEPEQLKQLVEDLQEKTDVPVEGVAAEESVYQTRMEDVNVLINASPVGMSPKVDNTPLKDEFIHEQLTVFDVVYNPLQTRLLREGAARGCRIVPGVEMFIQQAVAQFELWTNIPAPVDCMRNVVLEVLNS
jgi:shikimate dehydrogenase